MPARQLALDFELRAALGWVDFLVVPGNADAVAWLDRWPEWPNRALAIYGPAGCGKPGLEPGNGFSLGHGRDCRGGPWSRQKGEGKINFTT